MIEKQFGTMYGPALKPGDKAACIRTLEAEIDKRGGVPFGWMRVYEVLLFGFYNARSGECFPSHQAIATKARCSVSTVQRALKWARENQLIAWAHGVVRHGWRVFRTSNRYAFAAFLSLPQKLIAFLPTAGQKARRVPTLYKTYADIDAEARARARNFRFPFSPLQLAQQQAVQRQ
jgi:hypothetical protein